VCSKRGGNGKIDEIDFWLVLLKKLHLRAEYSGIEGWIILKRKENVSVEYQGKDGRKILKMTLEEQFVKI
jgi:hypothetical protein